MGLLKQIQPRLAVLFGCAMLWPAGMAGLVAWSKTVPPRSELRQVTGQLEELVLQDAGAKITLTSEGTLYTFEFKNADRLAALPLKETAVTVAYYPSGRAKMVADVTLGQDHVLNYEDVAGRAASEAAEKRVIAIGIAALGTVMILLGGAARIARSGSKTFVKPSGERTFYVLFWLFVYGGVLSVILSRPETMHRDFGTEVFHLPIEYVLPMALALLFLPMWPGFIDLVGDLAIRRAMRKGRGHLVGSSIGWAILALWPFLYFFLLIISWIIYASIKGI